MALGVAAAGALLAGCGDGDRGADTVPGGTTGTATATSEPVGLALVDVVDGLEWPTQTIPLPGGDRLLILEQSGRIRLFAGGGLQPEPVADLTGRIRSGGEQGLLSLALHPDFASNGLVYIHLSDPNGDTRVEEHRMQGDRIAGQPARVLLEVDQPYANHNGGSLAFGRDGRLYLGLGDGGSANDPQGNAQDPDSRLGKLLRLDVDSSGADWEIAAYGLRNPWRFAFDSRTGDAWIGDVGQNQWEEVDVFPPGSGLLNFGWDVYEGPEASSADGRSDLNGDGELTPPVAWYDHDEGCSITGGVVVRDGDVAAVRDRYIYGDFCSGTIWTVPVQADREPRKEDIRVEGVVSFDRADDGTVYVTSRTGSVQRLAPAGG